MRVLQSGARLSASHASAFRVDGQSRTCQLARDLRQVGSQPIVARDEHVEAVSAASAGYVCRFAHFLTILKSSGYHAVSERPTSNRYRLGENTPRRRVDRRRTTHRIQIALIPERSATVLRHHASRESHARARQVHDGPARTYRIDDRPYSKNSARVSASVQSQTDPSRSWSSRGVGSTSHRQRPSPIASVAALRA